MSEDSLWADIVAVAKRYGVDLSQANGHGGRREPKPQWHPTGGNPFRLCGECGHWEDENKRTRVEGKWISIHLGFCEVDGMRHDRCQRECEQWCRKGWAEGEWRGGNPHQPTKVQRLDNGQIYESARKAAEETGIADHRLIRAAARGDKKTAGGLEWRYLE